MIVFVGVKKTQVCVTLEEVQCLTTTETKTTPTILQVVPSILCHEQMRLVQNISVLFGKVFILLLEFLFDFVKFLECKLHLEG